MSKQSDIKQEIEQEHFILEMTRDHYERNYEVLKPPQAKVLRVKVTGEDHSEDETHKALLKDYLKASKRLRDYEFDKRHNK